MSFFNGGFQSIIPFVYGLELTSILYSAVTFYRLAYKKHNQITDFFPHFSPL